MTLLLNSLIRILYRLTVHCGLFIQNPFLFPIACLVFSVFRTLPYAPRQAPPMNQLSTRSSPLILFPTYLISITGIVCEWPKRSPQKQLSLLASRCKGNVPSVGREDIRASLTGLGTTLVRNREKGLCVVSRFKEDRLPLFRESLSLATVSLITFSNGSR